MRQFIKVGLMVGGADLEQVTEAQGKADNAARQSSDCHAAAMTAQAKSKGGYASFFVASSS